MKPCVSIYSARGQTNTTCFRNAVLGPAWAKQTSTVIWQNHHPLGGSDPTALAKLNKHQYEKLVKEVNSMLRKLNVPSSIDKMKISRCDLTVNIGFSSRDELVEYLRIFKKGLCIYHYSRVFFSVR